MERQEASDVTIVPVRVTRRSPLRGLAAAQPAVRPVSAAARRPHKEIDNG